MSDEMPKNEMPKGAMFAQSQDDLEKLTKEDILQGFERQTILIRAQCEYNKTQLEEKKTAKELNDADTMLHNAKIMNELSEGLVRIFFGKFCFAFWIAFYLSLNISLYRFCGESARFYIGLIDKVGIFVIVCILGKFLKDNLALFVEAFRK